MEVTARVEKEYMDVYHDEGPVLYAKRLRRPRNPEQELVYFT